MSLDVRAVRDQNAGEVLVSIPGYDDARVPDNLSGYETLHLLATTLNRQVPGDGTVLVEVAVHEQEDEAPEREEEQEP